MVTSEALRYLSEYIKPLGSVLIYCLPSLIKLFKPDPRPVTAALPPMAMVIAVNTALLPPAEDRQGS